jgi:signal transduction histidine kinase
MKFWRPQKGWAYVSWRFFAVMVILLGLIVLTGWTFNILTFRRFLTKLVSMNPLTAVCFILEGIALLNTISKKWRLLFCILPCLIVCILIFLKLTIFIPSITIRIDGYLFADRLDDNRMAPVTAINLLLSAVSIMLLSKNSWKPIAAAQFIGLIIFIVALSAIMGYMYNIRSAYAVDIFFPIAFHTALCFLFISLGIFCARYNDGFMNEISAKLLGGSLIRRMLPLAIFIPLLLEWARFEVSMTGIISEKLSIAVDNILIILILSVALWIYARFLNQFDKYRQSAEKDLIKAKNVADEARKSQELFLANMSHEIRTPMNGVIGMTSLLQRTSLTEEQKSFVDTIRVSGESLLVIINDILDFSKIEAGKLDFEEKPFIVQSVIEETFDLLANEAQKKNLSLTYTLDKNVPEFIFGDITRIRQILVNLVSNGIKFTQQGGISITISVKEQADKEPEIEFRVKDTGMGIPPDKLDRLFQAFSQIDASITRKFGGTGLGLAICSRLIRLMGGTIGVESKLNEGSVFYFTLKLKVAEIQKSPENLRITADIRKGETTPVISEGENLARQLPLRILIAEDNAINIRLVLKMLENLGYTADVAGNGLEAIEALKRQQYDFVLMDILMPELDGLQATAEIRALPLEHQPVIIALTANALFGEEKKYINGGANDYLLKPFLISQLENMIIKWAGA